ncbi:hypothetical protein QQF64_026292 [Cirrhinus molitorella]|uniref:Uncharacterized protein n=1 Tax=Cirrhinus molitorella TaxID=172907 RepID=A0ABR3NRQ6_9TELE
MKICRKCPIDHASAAASDSETLIPVSRSNSETTSRQTAAAAPAQSSSSLADPAETEVSWTAALLFRVIVIIVEFAAFAAPTVILLQIICARRAENYKKTEATLKK